MKPGPKPTPRPVLYIFCQRPGCGGIKRVRWPCEQRKLKYCGYSCSSIMTNNLRHADRRAAARHTRRTYKAIVRAKVEQLSPVAAFELGYKLGLNAKWRQLRQRYVVIARPKNPAA